jgi:hypothetical protein
MLTECLKSFDAALKAAESDQLLNSGHTSENEGHESFRLGVV